MLQRVIGALIGVSVLCCGCSSGGAGRTAGRAETPSPVPPAISAPESRRVLDDYVTRQRDAVGSGDAKAWRDAATGPLREVRAAQAVANGGRPPASGRISLVNPVMYVPRLAGYPRWFATAALEERPGGGEPVEVLLLFVRADAAGGWRAAHRLPFKGRPPEISFDDQGYALVPAPDATGFATAPGTLPGAHAAYLNGADPGAFGADAYSVSQRVPQSGGGGWSRADRFAAGRHPVYALRTSDGGALVWYAVEQTTRLTRGGSGSAATLPPAIRGYLDGGGEDDTAGDRVEATSLWQAVGYLPGRGRPTVLGENVTVVSATLR